MMGVYEGRGVRFEYPPGWELEVDDDGTRTVIAVSEPGGTAFTLVTLDDDRPAATEMADEAMEAMRAEYPELDAYPASELIGGYKAVGHDLEFFTLDLLGACTIRCFRTPRRTVMLMNQWSESVDGDHAALFRSMRQSFSEVDET